MLKKLILLLIISVIIPLTDASFEASNRDIRVLVNNAPVITDVAPIMEAGRTLVPARAVLEALGATVVWRSDGTINITKNSRQILLRLIDTGTAAFNRNECRRTRQNFRRAEEKRIYFLRV